MAEKTGVYEFTQSNQTSKNNIIVFDSEINELGHVSSPNRVNSIKFYALKDKTYYIFLEKLDDVTEYSATYCLNFEKEMEYVPSVSFVVEDRESYKDLLEEGKNFSFDAETRTLEIKDFSGKSQYIRLVDEDGSIAWDPDDVYGDDPIIKIKILGKNTIDLGYTDFGIGGIGGFFGVRYIGDGVLNLQSKGTSDRSNSMYSKGMVIDGPTINVVKTCSIEKRNYPAVYVSGDFEMISGELNINTKGYALRITEDAYLKGGKININISEATDRCAFDVSGEMNFAGTAVNIDVKDVKDINVRHFYDIDNKRNRHG